MTVPRGDLLAITAADLEAYSNRGIVRRAEREVQAPELHCEWSADNDGAVQARWSDGVTCTFPGGKTLKDARCTCPSTTLCRHVVRTILAYQRRAESTAALPLQEPWNPGDIPDEAVQAALPRDALPAARRQFDAGLLVELVRSAKPTATFHGLGATLRFLVPGDPRYAHADCSGPLAEQLVAMAVWAFRILPPERGGGYVVTGAVRPPLVEPLADAEGFLERLLEEGISAAPAHLEGRMRQIESRLRDAELVWPAEHIAELAAECVRYAQRDSLFNPARAAQLVGSFLIRADALRSNTGAVPPLLVAGSSSDREQNLAARHLVGLGCAVQLLRRGVILRACLHDRESGGVTVVERAFPDPADGGEPRDFFRLADSVVVKGVRLADIGAGQLLIGSGRRTPAGRLTPGRRMTVNPQTCAWEDLKEPLRVDDYEELQRRLASLPPASLRPCWVAEDFHVLQVASAGEVSFDTARQRVEAVLRDGWGRAALLSHAYVSRAAPGAEALLAELRRGTPVRFVAGHVRLAAGGVQIHPTALVFESEGRRRLLQPWVHPPSREEAAEAPLVSPGAPSLDADPIGRWLADAESAMGEILVLGLHRADAATANAWSALAGKAESCGLLRLARPCRSVADSLGQKQHSLEWDSRACLDSLVQSAAMVRIAVELQL